MQEVIKVGILSLVEFLNRTGFTDGFLHGSSRETVNTIMESQDFQDLIEEILNNVGNNRIKKEQVTYFLKELFEMKINMEKGTYMSENIYKIDSKEITILCIQKLVATHGIKKINLQEKDAERISKFLDQCVNDRFKYGKPLYTIGDTAGRNTTIFLKNTMKEAYDSANNLMFSQVRQRKVPMGIPPRGVTMDIQQNVYLEDHVENSRCPCPGFRSCTII